MSHRQCALPAALRRTLQDVFGPTEWREGQETVIRRVLAAQDTLALMPVGTSRSLCGQLSAFRFKGPVLVVCLPVAPPQGHAGTPPATGVAVDHLDHAMPARAPAPSMHRPRAGPGEVVFTTPGQLADPGFLAALRKRHLALVVIDASRCISTSGHDVRCAFVEIGRALKALGDPPVLALAAGAPPQVVGDLRDLLGRPGLAVVETGLYRPNLTLAVLPCTREDEKLRYTLETLHHEAGSGIVYTTTVKACDDLHELLRGAGESVARYHAKLPRAERTRSQERFLRGEARVMVATETFGTGIDKTDLRFVLHWQMPGSLQAYGQEAGRAGRDGRPATAALLFDGRDKRVRQLFLARRHPSAEDLSRVHGVLENATAPLALAAIAGRVGDMPRRHVGVVLEMLNAAHAVHADRQRTWMARAVTDAATLFERIAADHAERAEREHAALERMVSYAQTGQCRWRVLLEHFGETLPVEGGRCGHCDNCLRPPVGPTVDAATARTLPLSPSRLG